MQTSTALPGEIKAIPHKDSAADAPPIFSSERAKRANSLTVIKRVLCGVAHAYPSVCRGNLFRRKNVSPTLA